MKWFALFIPTLFLASILRATFKKVNVYNSCVRGVKNAVPLILDLFPYVAVVMMMTEVFSASGLEEKCLLWLSPVLQKIGVPTEIAPLLIFKPLSGSGSTAVLSRILGEYGVDGYVGKCACVVYGSTETVFYMNAVYYSKCVKKSVVGLIWAVFGYFVTVALAVLVCRWL